jgi:hypothetical protein
MDMRPPEQAPHRLFLTVNVVLIFERWEETLRITVCQNEFREKANANFRPLRPAVRSGLFFPITEPKY